MGSLPEENLKITFFTDAPFIVKFRFEKYRYLLTFLLCIQIFEAPLSHSHSTGPQNISAGRLVPLSVACLVWWHSFRPQIYDESKTDQILNAKYFVWNNYTLGKWGSRKAFNQNSLMQLFNGDRPIVHCVFKMPYQPVYWDEIVMGCCNDRGDINWVGRLVLQKDKNHLSRNSLGEISNTWASKK